MSWCANRTSKADRNSSLLLFIINCESRRWRWKNVNKTFLLLKERPGTTVSNQTKRKKTSKKRKHSLGIYGLREQFSRNDIVNSCRLHRNNVVNRLTGSPEYRFSLRFIVKAGRGEMRQTVVSAHKYTKHNCFTMMLIPSRVVDGKLEGKGILGKWQRD